MRILTGGESHGEYITAILEGFPKGVKVEAEFIDRELRSRMSGAGRGKRMAIEDDKVEIVSGLRNKVTLGSPITMLVKNKDARIFSQRQDDLPALSLPRPAHADLAGALKYQERDVRNILERASARESAARVCAGAVCKQFLLNFGVKIASFTVSVGPVVSGKKPRSLAEIVRGIKGSKLNCMDKEKEEAMLAQIAQAEEDKDALGGVCEVWVEGACPGLGDFTHFDRRLDAKLAYYLMSIPAVKGVEVGLGFEYAKAKGSSVHDAIYYRRPAAGAGSRFYRRTNNSGGIEGGMTTGEPVVLRAAMKPIATLRKPLDSVDLGTKKKGKAMVERSDTCAVVACGVIAESMAALAVTEAFLDKFGRDGLREIKANYQNYLEALAKL